MTVRVMVSAQSDGTVLLTYPAGGVERYRPLDGPAIGVLFRVAGLWYQRCAVERDAYEESETPAPARATPAANRRRASHGRQDAGAQGQA